jgi:DNA-directed RNA polymerase subunit RPC12/RpoP
MLDSLKNKIKQQLFKAAMEAVANFICPKCGFKFNPFQGREITSWGDKIVCQKCGHSLALAEAVKSQAELKVNPAGPFQQPAGSRIERKPVSGTELLFYIPSSGKGGFLLFFAVLWNAISWLIFLAFLLSAWNGEGSWLAMTFLLFFPLIGILLLYIALRVGFSAHLLYLSPDRIRLQRQLFASRKNYDLQTSRVASVRKVEFYQQNYQPVYGIELKSQEGKIRFGSVLTDDEKNWLCWEIREFIKPYAQE